MKRAKLLLLAGIAVLAVLLSGLWLWDVPSPRGGQGGAPPAQANDPVGNLEPALDVSAARGASANSSSASRPSPGTVGPSASGPSSSSASGRTSSQPHASVGSAGAAGPLTPGNSFTPTGATGPSSSKTGPVLGGGFIDVADALAGVDLSIPSERERVAAHLKNSEDLRMQGVVEKARALGVPVIVKKPGGGISEIFAFEGDEPVYRTTFNHNAGVSSGADVLRGGGFGNLSGMGLTAGVWDGGLARDTHQEFAEGQVALSDPESVYLDHATHVAATLAGIGFQPDAHGMAPEAKVDSYDWNNDHGEMTLAGAALASGEKGKIPISNHSYGLIFSPDRAGYYDALARGSDALTYGLPYYLQFWSAGNDQARQLDGYFTIGDYALAKNIVTVGAVEDAVGANGQRDTGNATMSDFSSWGPAKDGRIKPDLVANGVDLYSAVDFSDQSYATYSGTSMASPSAAGTAALLVELYRKEFGGQLPLASLLKALLLHTADDRGRPGPDYQFGWGLINGPEAGDVILAHKTSPTLFGGSVDTSSRRWTHTFTRAGSDPLRATLVWTDPAGEVSKPPSSAPVLVHNLDLKIVGPDGTEHLPYVMPYVANPTPAALSLPASRGTNNVDNVEMVDVAAPAAGEYLLVVTAQGAMKAAQNFSIVLTGAGPAVNARPTVNLQAPQNGEWFLPGRKVTMTATATDKKGDGSVGTVAKVEFLVDGNVQSQDLAAPYEFGDWTPAAGNYVVEARATDSEGAVGYSSPAAVTVRDPLPGEVHPAFTPPSANNPVLALAEDNQQRIYIGGAFTTLNTTTVAQRIARLFPDGTVDTSGFVLDSGPDDRVRALVFSAGQQALYVGGDFAKVGAVQQRALARLHIGRSGQSDGSLDGAFAPNIASANPRIKASVRAILLQPDGKLVIGGHFDSVNGVERRNIARLNPDGTLDPDFNPAPNNPVSALALQADGKILLGGEFTALGASVWNRLARVNPDGTPDPGLVLGTGQQTGFGGPVHSIALDGSGNVYVGGSFNSYRGHPYHFNLVKLGPDGALAGNFNFEPGLDGSVYDISIPVDGKVLVSGAFTQAANDILQIAATAFGRVVLFKADGTLDKDFNVGGTGADNTVNRSLRLSSGNFLLAGSFASFNGVARSRLALIAGPSTAPPAAPSGAVASRLRATSAAGESLDLKLFAGAASPLKYRVVGALPRGMTLDETTGRLVGSPLDSGYFEVRVSATSPDGKKSEVLLGLSVAEAAVSYEQWRRTWFDGAEAHLSGAAAVNNPAGLSNFEVYALSGGDPMIAGTDLFAAPQFVQTAGGRRVTWRIPKFRLANHGTVTNVIYQPEVADSPDGPWQPVAATHEANSLRVPAAEGLSRQFLRLRLKQP